MIGPVLTLPHGGKECYVEKWTTLPREDLATLVAKKNGSGNRGVRLDDYASLDPDSPGARTLMEQWKREGVLSRTVAWKTASGAERHLYQRPPDLTEALFISIIRFQLRTGAGMQDVIPPSYVKDLKKEIDGHYEWLPGQDPESIEVAPLPETILAYFRTHADKPVMVKDKTPIADGVPPATAAPDGGKFDLAAYLSHHNIEVIKLKEDAGGTRHCLAHCVFDETHTPNDASIHQPTEGPLTYQCFHDTCKGRTWADARMQISGEAKLGQFMVGGGVKPKAPDYDRGELPPDWRGPQAAPKPQGNDLKCEVLTPSNLTLLTERLKTPPPPRKYLYEDIITTGIVGGIVAMGGTGKGFFIISCGLSLATGEKIGPLKPARTFKVAYLAGEDDQDELDRRVAATVNALWPNGPPSTIDNFIPISVMGKIKPLMELDKNHNPVNSPTYEWLCKSLENLADLDVLILDPKSKFYGLEENDNGHNAAWINCLESLAARFKITILFSHHESKARAGSMEQHSSRGGGALTDGCRWVANLKTMDLKTAEKFQVADPQKYVVLDVTKSNYAPKLPAPIYFKRGSDGELMYVDLAVERLNALTLKLVDLLEIQTEPFSRNDLVYEKRGKEIADELRETVSGFSRVTDVNRAIDHGLRAGWLFETRQNSTRGRGKLVLKVKTGPES
jgi:hypothetical protein